MIHKLGQGRAKARMPRSLILEPTRELAAQVAEQFEKYGAGYKLNMALLIGGVSFGDQEKKLNAGVDVLIATPGRLMDHFERGGLLMTGVQMLVIDEADRMLDMGFIPDIEKICTLLPKTRQTLLFSATMPPEITRLAKQFQNEPVRIEVSKPATAATTITQYVTHCPSNEDTVKRAVLRSIIKAKLTDQGIVFCNRKTRSRRRRQVAGRATASTPRRSMATCRRACAPQTLDRFRNKRAEAAGRLRRRRARPRHPGSQPGLQLRPAAELGRLCPPHRPHGPRRPLGRKLHHRLPGRRAACGKPCSSASAGTSSRSIQKAWKKPSAKPAAAAPPRAATASTRAVAARRGRGRGRDRDRANRRNEQRDERARPRCT